MPKLKTKKSFKKRVKKTAKGKFKRSSANKGHILTKKSRKRKRKLRRGALVDSTRMKSIKRLLPY